MEYQFLRAVISFCFGGRLCIMRPRVAESLSYNNHALTSTLRKGPVKIFTLSKLLQAQHLPTTHMKINNSPISTPFINCSEQNVLSYLQDKSGKGNSDNELLWKLILIASMWKGRIRSAHGIADPEGPEAAVVNLLLQNEGGSDIGDLASLSAGGESGSNAIKTQNCFVQCQKLLFTGKREESVACALAGGDFALALLIASLCGPSIYHTVSRFYIQQCLPSGSPLHTAADLFANQIITSRDSDNNDFSKTFWTDRNEKLDESWPYHLATILSNQTRGWKHIVVALGDELSSLGNMNAAHFCYLIGGQPIASYKDPSSRLVLIGCDHKRVENIGLISAESWEAYLMTEAFEWAKRRGNPNAVITTLQPNKLRYAEILADFGFQEAAKSYVESIKTCTRSGSTVDVKRSRVNSPTIYSTQFLESLEIFEDRLSISLGIQNIEDQKKVIKPSLTSVLSKMVSKSKPDDCFHDPIETIDFNSSLEDDTNDNLSFVSATSNILDMSSSTMVHTCVKSKNVVNPTKSLGSMKVMESVKENPDDIGATMKHDLKYSHSLLSPQIKNNPQQRSQDDDLQSAVEEKDIISDTMGEPRLAYPPASPQTAPPSTNVATPVEPKGKVEAPSSASSWSIGTWIAKKLNPDATLVSDIGNSMDAVFDKEYKVWVFPGENAAEKVKSMKVAPPPIPSKRKESSNKVLETPTSKSDDPIASLMAPPSRTTPMADPISSLMVPPTRATPFSKRVPVRPITSTPTKHKPPISAPSPQFVIFKPKEVDEGKSQM